MISVLEYQKYENFKKLQNTYSELTFMWQPIAKNFIKMKKLVYQNIKILFKLHFISATKVLDKHRVFL